MKHGILFITGLFLCLLAAAQTMAQGEQCGTIGRLQERLLRNPGLRERFERERAAFNRLVTNRSVQAGQNRSEATALYTIPVVFHIVLPNPSVVTDARIQAQLDTLNQAFSGTNADAARIPGYFLPLFGKSAIRFCLAQRMPNGDSTSGIVRTVAGRTSFSATADGVKHAAAGGADSWDESRYLNIWVCVLSNNVLGYATFPGDGDAAEQGVVLDYRSLPEGSRTGYNGGKTLPHEIGHYFNLYHIWGDDNGGCSGTDYVEDTPNQAAASNGCNAGIKTDNCTAAGNGIMYQNYMDYSYDQCLVLFTHQQVGRMETALALYRSSLLASDACQPPYRRQLDAELLSVEAPAARLCQPAFAPAITVRNNGTQTLTSLQVTALLNNGSPLTHNWTGMLPKGAVTTISLGSMTVPEGRHLLAVSVAQLNAQPDEWTADNARTVVFQYYPPVAAVGEGFEGGTFPPVGWDVVNGDAAATWEPAIGSVRPGTGSVAVSAAEAAGVQSVVLRLPQVAIGSGVDSAFLSFGLAAAGTYGDTLEVLASLDCGATYTVLHKKWGAGLSTLSASGTAGVTNGAGWRKDSVDLAPYRGTGNLLLAFRHTGSSATVLFLDEVHLRTVTVNPNLKAAGFLVTPNPAGSTVAVQFYPQPVNLRSIQLLNMSGQVLQTIPAGDQGNFYRLDVSRYPGGVYIVRAVFGDRVVTQKVMKY